MKCWCCIVDHMHCDCPHRDEKLRIVHNLKLTKIIEYMGGIVTNICAALDSKIESYERLQN